jgi:hypothetical protein
MMERERFHRSSAGAKLGEDRRLLGLSDGGAERNEAVVVWALQRRWLGLRQIN